MTIEDNIVLATRVHKGRNEYLLQSGKWVSRQRVWQLRKERTGLCHICGKPSLSKSLCRKHLEYQRKKTRIYARTKRGIPLNKPLTSVAASG